MAVNRKKLLNQLKTKKWFRISKVVIWLFLILTTVYISIYAGQSSMDIGLSFDYNLFFGIFLLSLIISSIVYLIIREIIIYISKGE